MESDWRWNVTKYGITYDQIGSSHYWPVLAAEMLDFPGKLIVKMENEFGPWGAIYEVAPGTEFATWYTWWVPIPPHHHFPYGFRVPADHPP